MNTIALDFTFILKANRFEDLMLPGEDRDQAFKRLAKTYHPDKHAGPNQEKATKVFQRISELHLGPSTPPVKIGKWTIRDPFCAGDISDLYLTDDDNIFKITRSRKDNDLMDRESVALRGLDPKNGEACTMRHYAPSLKENLTASTRRVNVVDYRPGFIPLHEIANRLGGTVDFRHIVWMMNRLLSIIGWAHYKGFVHGAVVPSHLLYRPESHDLVLVDWCYSAQNGQKIPAIVKKYKSLYAPEVFNKGDVRPGIDLFMAASTLRSVCKNVPKRFEPMFDWAMVVSPGSRPPAWTYQDRWISVAKEEYGEPKFVKLEIPVH